MHVELYPYDYQPHEILAIIYIIRKQMDLAILEYKKILELNPDQPEYLRKIGAIYRRQGDFENALSYYQKIYKIRLLSRVVITSET